MTQQTRQDEPQPPRRLTDAEKALCALAADLVPLLPPAWTSIYDTTERRRQLFIGGDTGPMARPLAVLTEDAGWADIEFLSKGAQMLAALVAGGRYLKWANNQLRAEIRQLRGEPDPEAKKPFSFARQCAIQCAKPDFKHWLHEIHGADIADQIRVDNHVRTMLRIESRAELDHDHEAARRWQDLFESFKRRAR